MVIKHNKIVSSHNRLKASDYNANHLVTNLASYELIEEKEITSSSGPFIFDGLDGDNDFEYYIEGEGHIVSTGGDGNMWINPNGDTGNVSAIGWSNTTGGSNAWGRGIMFGEMTIKASTGKARLSKGTRQVYVSGAGHVTGIFGGVWKNTTSNITGFNVSVSTGSVTGTIKLYKKVG